MTTRTCGKSVKGTELTVGDVRYMGWKQEATVVKTEAGQLAAGARYQDVTTDDGNTDRRWEGFLYRIVVEVPLTLENATVAELAAIQ